MLNHKGFDLWADGYDKSVGLSDEANTYPFAGYKKVLAAIFQTVMQTPNASVLDIGFGTAVLTAKLYEPGLHHLRAGFLIQNARTGIRKNAGRTAISGRLYNGSGGAAARSPL